MAPNLSPAAERLADVAHPTGFGVWIWAPLLVLVMTATAVVSGGLTALGRAAILVIEGLVLGVGLLGRLRRRPGSAMARLVTLHPEAPSHGRLADGVFHAPPAKPAPTASAAMPADEVAAVVERAMANMPAKGHDTRPDDTAALAVLLSTPPPANDFKVADMVRDCFASLGADAQSSRALLAVARHLADRFGTPAHLPLATVRAWRMLDPVMFEDEMAAQLAAVSQFITNWQRSQQTFLCLEFGEVELIEFLFESLPPARHSDILCDVLNFKVLSNRRQGILRRIPHRMRKFVQDAGGRGADTLATVEANRTLLDRVAASHGYPPIIEAATTALEEVKKIAEKLQPPPPANPAEAEQPLARITPVRRPATEAEIAAMAAAVAPVQAAPVPAPLAPPPLAPPRQQIAAPPTGRRAIAPSQHLRSGTPPFQSPGGIGTVATREVPPMVGTAARQLPPGSRAPLPSVAMNPLPVLAQAAPPPPAAATPTATTVTGRITLPPPGQPAAAPKPPMPTATGRIVIPPARPPSPPAEAKASVTALTVVPKSKRIPITQAIKRQSVLKVLRGESAASVAATLGIRESKLDEWVDAFITAGAGALSPSPRRKRTAGPSDDTALSTEMLRAKLAEVLATAQLIERAMDAQTLPRRPILLPPPDDGSRRHSTKRPHKKV